MTATITPEAEDADRSARWTLDPKNPAARFYLGLAAAQNGDKDKARRIWTGLLPDLPEDSPANRAIKEKLAMLDAPMAQGAPPSGEAAALLTRARGAAEDDPRHGRPPRRSASPPRAAAPRNGCASFAPIKC